MSTRLQRQVSRDEPDLPGPVEAATSTVFSALTRVRGPRVFHPHGHAFTCTLTLSDSAVVRGAGLAAGQQFAGLVRMSRSAGLPAPLPDARGIGLRLFDFPDDGNVQDLLFVTSAPGRVARRGIVFTGGYLRRIYSSLLGYDFAGHRVILGLRPHRPACPDTTLDDLAAAVSGGQAVFALQAAPPWGPWENIGVLRLDRPLEPGADEELAFNPWHDSAILHPVGLLNALRNAAYRGSQAAR